MCAAHLPLGPRPIFRVSVTARILINSQAPGTKAHRSGIPFDDASGERLRAWMGIDPALFYDPALVAIVPMGLCYPGMSRNGGDAPPRPECAPLWLERFVTLMPAVRLTLLVGSHAQRRRLGAGTLVQGAKGQGAKSQGTLGYGTITETVRRFSELAPAVIPLPHPSWRTRIWEARNPWFAEELLPVLRATVGAALGG